MKVRFYGRLGDMVGRELALDAPPGGFTVAELRQTLAQRHPEAEADLSVKRLRPCVDDVLVGEDFRVGGDCEVEFFPPLSGG